MRLRGLLSTLSIWFEPPAPYAQGIRCSPCIVRIAALGGTLRRLVVYARELVKLADEDERNDIDAIPIFFSLSLFSPPVFFFLQQQPQPQPRQMRQVTFMITCNLRLTEDKNI